MYVLGQGIFTVDQTSDDCFLGNHFHVFSWISLSGSNYIRIRRNGSNLIVAFAFPRLGTLAWRDGNQMESLVLKPVWLEHLGKCTWIWLIYIITFEMMTNASSFSSSRYLAPEYAQSGQITEKADVYSFGVVLLELVTGRKAVDLNRPKGQQCLTEWVRAGQRPTVQLIWCWFGKHMIWVIRNYKIFNSNICVTWWAPLWNTTPK